MQSLTHPGAAVSALAGRHIVEITRLDSGVYRVETRHTGLDRTPVDELTRSFPDRELARHVATVIWGTLRKPAATIADARMAVAAYFDRLIGRLADTPNPEVAELVAELQTYRAGYTDSDDEAPHDTLAGAGEAVA